MNSRDFASISHLMDAILEYKEQNSWWENEWVDRFLERWNEHRNLSPRQLQVLYSIADDIGLKPGWNED